MSSLTADARAQITEPLLPCPFCGGDALPAKDLRDGYEEWPDDPDAYAYVIRCRCCAAQGGWSKSSLGAAARLWNERSSPAQPERPVAGRRGDEGG